MYENFFNKARDIIIRRTTKHMSMTPHLEVVKFLNPRNKTDSDNLISITDELRSMPQYYFKELGFEGISALNKIDKVNIQMAAYVLGGGLWELESEKETVVHYWTRQVVRAPELARVACFLVQHILPKHVWREIFHIKDLSVMIFGVRFRKKH